MLKAQPAIKAMRVLLVNPSDDAGRALQGRLHQAGYAKVTCAESAEEALRLTTIAAANREPLDLLVLTLGLPDRQGLEAFDDLHQLDAAIILVAEHEQRHLAETGLERGADDAVIKPVAPELLLLRIEKVLTQRYYQGELRRASAHNEGLFLNVLAVMAKVLEAKDPNTRFHSERVCMFAMLIGRELGLPEEEVRRVGVAGILHDIGKMGIRESLLRKPGPLDKAEREMVERHPLIATAILEPIEQLQTAVSYIKCHHEHFDGSGYPQQLKGEAIPLGARIVHVAESFESMTSKRTYSGALSLEQALAELQRCAGKQFDPRVVDALIAAMQNPEHARHALDTPPKSLPQLLVELSGHSEV